MKMVIKEADSNLNLGSNHSMVKRGTYVHRSADSVNALKVNANATFSTRPTFIMRAAVGRITLKIKGKLREEIL